MIWTLLILPLKLLQQIAHQTKEINLKYNLLRAVPNIFPCNFHAWLLEHFAPRPFMTRLKLNLWLPTVVLRRSWLKFSYKKSMNEKNLFYFFCSRSLYNYDVITWRKDIIDSLLPFKFFFSGGRFRLLIIILLTISITSLTIGTLLLVVFCFYYHK